MRIISIFVLATLSFHFSLAQESVQSSSQPLTASSDLSRPANILKSNIEVGGSFALGYGSATGFGVTLNPAVEYFVMDKLSVGGTVNLYTSADYQTYGAGPSFTYYFMQKAQWAAFAGGSGLYNNNYASSYNAYSNLSVTAKVGLNYFVDASVAFGPSLSYTEYSMRNSGGYDPYQSSNISLLFHLSVFL